jgi:hypothetical protein
LRCVAGKIAPKKIQQINRLRRNLVWREFSPKNPTAAVGVEKTERKRKKEKERER